MTNLTLPDSLNSFSGTIETKSSTNLKNIRQTEAHNRKASLKDKALRGKNRAQFTTIWNSPPPLISPVTSSNLHKPINLGKTAKPIKSLTFADQKLQNDKKRK